MINFKGLSALPKNLMKYKPRADYGDGQKHVAAFAARHEDERVYSYAEEVQFDASGCGVKIVRLAQSDRAPSP